MAGRILKFEEAVCWLNGVSLAGAIAEIELPEITWGTVDHETISGIGTPQFPTKLEPLECTITWASYSPEMAAAAADPWRAVNLMVRANIGDNASSGKVADKLLRVDLTGRFISNPGGSFSAGEMERESMMIVTFFKETYDGVEQFAVDVNIPSYRVKGSDRLAQRRANLGG